MSRAHSLNRTEITKKSKRWISVYHGRVARTDPAGNSACSFRSDFSVQFSSIHSLQTHQCRLKRDASPTEPRAIEYCYSRRAALSRISALLVDLQPGAHPPTSPHKRFWNDPATIWLQFRAYHCKLRALKKTLAHSHNKCHFRIRGCTHLRLIRRIPCGLATASLIRASLLPCKPVLMIRAKQWVTSLLCVTASTAAVILRLFAAWRRCSWCMDGWIVDV